MNIILTFPALLSDRNSGAPASVLELVRQYESRGHRVRLLTLEDMPSALPQRARIVLFPLFLAKRCRELVRHEQVDVIDGNCGDLWACAVAKRRARRPILVYRSHGCVIIYFKERLQEAALGRLRVSWRDRLYHRLVKRAEVQAALAACDAAVFLSRAEARHAAEELGADPRRSHVVPLGLSTVYLGRPLDPTPADAAAPIRIAMIGHYIPRKGVRYAAEALNRILGEFPKAAVSYFGTGVEPSAVLADLDGRWHDRVTIVARFENADLPELLRGHVIKLFPTLAEGFGKVLIEAMACGLAPVAADAEGVLDIVTDNVNGLVVPRRDSAALAMALRRLISDRRLLNRLRAAAHAHAQGFTWTRSAEARLEIYRQALHARNDAPDRPRSASPSALAQLEKT